MNYINNNSGRYELEKLNQEDFTTRVEEISRNISRIYDEMESDERLGKRVENTKADQIRRLIQYYKEQVALGTFVDPETGRKKNMNEICRTVMQEMDARNFTGFTKHQVWIIMPNECKRAWRKPIDTIEGKLTKVSLPKEDIEVETVYNAYMDHVNELMDFDYNELPKNLRISLGEHFYKCYRDHEKQWQTHGMSFIKHSDGLNIDNPFADIVRLRKGKPQEGMLYKAWMEYIEVCKEVAKKVKTGILDENGNRRISLEDEQAAANGLTVMAGFLKPMKNDKWKRDILGWADILLKKIELRSKSGAAKSSRKSYEVEGMTGKQWRGITREEIDKNQARMIKYFKQFVEYVPAFFMIHQQFIKMFEEPRAIHSIELSDKLSDSA
ncbi:hypothetical protein [Serratia sp. (in: enterobacteria)]|uniref:hypothetical protein n=1 Tax=Serratia sp. (in: enterobacteria) TaxID=616 RepID=UPI00398A2F58